MSKTLLSRIKNPWKSTPPNSSSKTRLRYLANKVSEILQTHHNDNTWEQILESQFSDNNFIVSDILDHIRDVDSGLKFFNWVSQRDPPDSRSYSALLKILARSKRFLEINAVLEKMNNQGKSPTREALDALIKAYSDFGSFEKALEFYSIAKQELNALPNVFACNSLLDVLVNNGRANIARRVYDEMLERDDGDENVCIDNYSTCIMVRGLCRDGKVEEGRKLIGDRWGCIPNVVFYNTLINGYCKKGEVQCAYELFRDMKLKGFLPTSISYGTVISGFCKEGNFELVDQLLEDMKSRGLKVNVQIYNNLIDAKCKHHSIAEGMLIFKQMLESGCEPDIMTYNTLISGSCRDGNVGQADDLLKEAMERGLLPNKFSYTPLVHGYYRERDIVRASNLFIEMMERGHRPDLVTYGVLVHGLVSVGELDDALMIHDKMIERGVLPDAAIYNVLMNGLCKKGRLTASKNLLAEMLNRNVLPDEFVYVTLIDGFTRHGDAGEAKKLFEFMVEKGIEPGVVGYNAMINCYCKFGMMNDAILNVNKMVISNLHPDTVTYTTVIDGYVKQNNMNGALRAFGDMVKRNCKPNIVTYSALINGFCREGDFDRAQEIFREIKSCGLAPNVITYSILIGSFSRDGKLGISASLFEEMLHNNCVPNDIIFHHLISGFAASKGSECPEHGQSIILDMFRHMVLDEWDYKTAAYNAIIICLCKHRMLEVALELGHKMLAKGCMPDSVTFVSLLHGICLEGRSREWGNHLSRDFDEEELQVALKYSILLDQYLYKGLTSEASGILQNIGRGANSKPGMDNQEVKALEVSVV
ncbi:pentatricopeptide repeat (PPR) superfamily protein [Tasmannia lanceolata]|uniref:pentatricopeptide repeat (PPR) superfamily protein n=1 Tax=Tasmannia lanceolata TaxID=3420 RepID=UPI0040629978